MEKISGYARLLARTRIQQQLNKTLLGKPYLKYGQCYVLSSYFFQLGGILGAKHSDNLDAFGPAFLGVEGEPEGIKRFLTGVANDIVLPSVTDCMTFGDYVGAKLAAQIGYREDPASFFLKHAMEKVTPESAEELAWRYAADGAAVGAIEPRVVRKMFERTHAVVPKEKWESARAAGLNIPEEQDRMSYEEVQEAEDDVFMAYCRECCPELCSTLVG